MAITITEPKARIFSTELSEGMNHENTLETSTLAFTPSVTKNPLGPYGKPVGHFDQDYDEAIGNNPPSSGANPQNNISVYALANGLKAQLIQHAADAAAHTTGTQNLAALVAVAAATTPATLEALLSALVTAYHAHIVDAEKAAAWSYHVAKEVANATLSSEVQSTQDNVVSILNDMRAKFEVHMNDFGAPGICHAAATTRVSSYGIVSIAHIKKDMIEPALSYNV